MNTDIQIKEATEDDLDFIIEAIIESDKSGSDISSFKTLYNLDTEQTRHCLAELLLMNIDGCEFSLNSFLIAKVNEEYAGAIAGWVEGVNEMNIPSYKLKSFLLSRCLPYNSLIFYKKHVQLLEDVHIERTPRTYQIEYVYVKDKFRGQRITQLLLEAHQKKVNDCTEMEVQLCKNNNPAFIAYSRFGFNISKCVFSNNKDILRILPDNYKLLMKKILKYE